MRFLSLFVGLFLGSFLCVHTVHAGEFVKRTVYGLGVKNKKDNFYFHPLQAAFATPLNHLGFNFELLDVGAEDFEKRMRDNQDIHGAISWLQGEKVKSPDQYVSLMLDKMTPEFKFLMLNDASPLGFNNMNVKPFLENAFLKKIGLVKEGFMNPIGEKVHYRFPMLERSVPSFLLLLPKYRFLKEGAKVWASVKEPNGSEIPLLANLNGKAYGNSAYMIHLSGSSKNTRWLVDPFIFLDEVFRAEKFPVPDITTLNGNRIYYSHIDGDSWRSKVEVDVADPVVRCAKVVLDEVVKTYKDLPLTMGFVVADIHPEWLGSEYDLQLAREILSYDHVEAGTHGWTHVLEWQFYENEARAKKLEADHFDLTEKLESYNLEEDEKLVTSKGYAAPRSVIHKPFSLEFELKGSADYITSLTNGKKPVKLYQWSGDCFPFERAIRMTREAGMRNINGGDSRFDGEFPTYAGVAPVGLKVKGQQQIFASNSNENIYTNDWTENFAGFSTLRKTFDNTEKPRRIRPMNIYYHCYAVEKRAALFALQQNFEYVRNHDHTPIFTTHYAGIADGFYKTRIEKMGENIWRIHDRELLNTFRFDKAANQGVDFEKSFGVMGQRHYQGNLYIFTDPSVALPVIALKIIDVSAEEPLELVPYMIQSRWIVENMVRGENKLTCNVKGFGPFSMTLSCPQKQQKVTLFDGQNVVMSKKYEGTKLHIEKPQLKANKNYRLEIAFS